MSNIEFETAKLLAHFKLQARRSGITADLGMMLTNGTYAAAIFHEVEEATEDEDLLVTMLRLRDRLLTPSNPSAEAQTPIHDTPVKAASARSEPKAAQTMLRDYRNGGRGF